MTDIRETSRASRAARITARRARALSKSLRAWLRAQYLIGRGIRKQSRDLHALVEAQRLTTRLLASSRREVAKEVTPDSQPARYESALGAAKISKA